MNNFRILADWDVKELSKNDTHERDGCFHHNRYAEIYPCSKTIVPKGYYFHELLHIALCSLREDYSKEREEMLVQDIEHMIYKE